LREIAGKEEAQDLLLEILGIDERNREETDAAAAIQRLREWRPELWEPRQPRDSFLPIRDEVIVGFSPALRFSKSLLDELEKIAEADDKELDQTALRAIYPHHPPTDPADDPEPSDAPLIELTPLNPEQRRACLNVRSSPLTVLTGPPGTGKSQVVRHVLLDRVARGETALFASRNHAAIEAVAPGMNALTAPYPLVIHVGRDGSGFDWKTFVKELLTRPSDASVLEARNAARERVESTLDARRAKEVSVTTILDLRNEYGRLVEAAQSLEPVPELRATLASENAIPAVEQAELWLGQAQKERSGLIARLWGSLTEWFRAVRDTDRKRVIGVVRSLPLEDRIAYLDALVHVARYEELQTEISRIEEAIRERPTPEEETHSLEATEKEHQDAAKEWLTRSTRAAGADLPQNLVTAFANIRAAFADSGGSIDPNQMDRKVYKLLLAVFRDVLERYPLWAVSNLSVRRTTPLAPGVFDVVVVDEASQCDIASTIPLLYRARRVLISGDPKQLTPVLTLGKIVEGQSRERHGLSDLSVWGRFLYTRNSCFDVAYSAPGLDRGRQLIQLRSHYRCHSSIIGYSNRLFYERTLRIRTNRDALRSPKGHSLGVRWTDVSGPIERVGNSSMQPALTDAVVKELERLIEEDFRGTVGVVSPFRPQANRISDAAHEKLPAEWLRTWDFAASTADGFQGGERDVILFALVGEPGWKSRFYGADPNRFNVAVTRARAVLHVFGDRDWAANYEADFVAELVDAAEASTGDREYSVRRDLIGPVWEPMLAEALSKHGLE
ncbi:MAG: ATP-binding protein, partial [Planctomycetes bacterium]|nr:ATP-binding protein [Planctomycetota bacterium]